MSPQVEQQLGADRSPALSVELPDQFGASAAVVRLPRTDGCGLFLPQGRHARMHRSRARNFATCTRHFRALDCAVVGVSTDSSAAHRAFADKHGFPFTLLADEAGELARAFGVLHNDHADRATFVIDRNRRVATDFHDVTPRGHAQRVLKFAQRWSNPISCLGAEGGGDLLSPYP